MRKRPNYGDAALPVTAPLVRVKSHTYQPSKVELEDSVRIDATPQQLAKAVVTTVRIVDDSDA